MPTVTKNLPAVDDAVTLDVDGYRYGSVQYVSGAGTVQVEATNQDIRDGTEIWYIPPDIAGVASIAQTVAGVIVFNIHGYNRIRIRKTVGVLDCVVSLGVS